MSIFVFFLKHKNNKIYEISFFFVCEKSGLGQKRKTFFIFYVFLKKGVC